MFALASYFEGYGVAIAEAMRRGLAVAVTNVGAVPALVTPEAGVVCALGDVEQLSKAMRRLIFDRPLLRIWRMRHGDVASRYHHGMNRPRASPLCWPNKP